MVRGMPSLPNACDVGSVWVDEIISFMRTSSELPALRSRD
jgi:hypothetical protein